MKLRILNDPILRKASSPVPQGEVERIKSLVPEMVKIMLEENGTGLAANQVGENLRFFIMNSGPDVKLILNPEIVQMSELSPFEEGCLSIPGVFAQTKRAQNIKLKYQDENFNTVELELSGLEAVVVQHEIDHLDGKLYIDQLSPLKRTMTVDKHRKFVKMRGRAK